MVDNQYFLPQAGKRVLSDRIAEEALKELFEFVENDSEILAVVIFGSYARKEPFHDINICLFSKFIPTSVDLERQYLLHFAECLDIHFFDELPLYIQIEVCRDGIIRINKDYDKLCDIYFATFRSYDSFYPRLRMIIDLH